MSGGASFSLLTEVSTMDEEARVDRGGVTSNPSTMDAEAQVDAGGVTFGPSRSDSATASCP